jgi:asparagine synthase (glutamine-hydrolysing)
MLKQVRGMFAFAIYDSSKRELFLARDRFGEKPLYYAWIDGAFFFASELNGLLCIDGLKRVVSRDVVAHYLTYFYNPLHGSFIEGVFRLPPGSTITLDLASGQTRTNQYWDLCVSPEPQADEQSVLNELESMISEAVRLKLVSDVPLGVLLSGGVDSSVITGIASKFLKNLQTFHVTFEGEGSEAEFARMVSERFGTDHHEFWLDTDLFKDFPQIVGRMDEPIADASILSTYCVCRAVRKNVTVCLTGLGGDELFWGYPWLQDYRELDGWFSVPKPVRRLGYALASGLGTRSGRLVVDLARYERLDYASLESRLKCIARLSHFTPAELSDSGFESDCFGTYLARMERIGDDRDARAYLTATQVLPHEYLQKDDRLSMANSLELRSPFLDHQFAEWAARLPHEYKTRRESKYILKKFAVTRLRIPKRAIYRRKTGFTVPIFGRQREMISAIENLRSRTDILPNRLINQVCKSLVSYENSARAFAILTLMEWATQFEIA